MEMAEVKRAVNLKELSTMKEILTPGHRMCAGCGIPINMRQILHAIDEPVVIVNGTGCLEVASSIYPYSSWDAPWIHSAFPNTASTVAGVEAAYKALKRKGKIDEDIKFLGIAGDGGTFDIGLQSLSGTLERGHNIVYVCYDNEAYMNTGMQRSSATPYGAWTTTTPVGKEIKGKMQKRKDLMGIVEAHDIPYLAQAAPSNWVDLIRKTRKAFAVEGPAFILTLSPCVPGWRYDPATSMDVVRLAVETSYWPLYEIENGECRLTHMPKEKLPITEWLRKQGRFKHLLDPENKDILDELQRQVDEDWENLLMRCGERKPTGPEEEQRAYAPPDVGA